MTVERLKAYGVSERMVRELVEKTARDPEAIRKVLQFINDRPDFFELLGGEDGLRRLTAGTARVRLEDIVTKVVTDASSTPKVIYPTNDRFAPVRAQILSPDQQIAVWVKANKGFGKNEIPKTAFNVLDSLTIPALTPEAMEAGYVGVVLFYGFGGNGTVSDMVLSALVPWNYFASSAAVRKWGSEKLGDPKFLRPFTGRHSERPVGFYWKLVQLGHAYYGKSVGEARGLISPSDWGMGPEGIQFLLTHHHYAELMNGGGLYPFIDLSDFEVSRWVDGEFSHTLSLDFNRDFCGRDMHTGEMSIPHPHYGSGSLR